MSELIPGGSKPSRRESNLRDINNSVSFLKTRKRNRAEIGASSVKVKFGQRTKSL